MLCLLVCVSVPMSLSVCLVFNLSVSPIARLSVSLCLYSVSLSFHSLFHLKVERMDVFLFLFVYNKDPENNNYFTTEQIDTYERTLVLHILIKQYADSDKLP